MRAFTTGPVSRLRYTGVAAVVVLWVGIGTGIARTGLDVSGRRPISYLGTDSRSSLLFTAVMLVAAVLLATFYLFVWSRFSSSKSFLAVGMTGLLGQVVAGVVPLSGAGASHAVHATGGIVVGLSLPLLMWRFAASQPASKWRTQSYGFFWMEVAAVIIGVSLSQSMRAPIAEIVPGAAFHLWIFVVTARSLSGREACT